MRTVIHNTNHKTNWNRSLLHRMHIQSHHVYLFIYLNDYLPNPPVDASLIRGFYLTPHPLSYYKYHKLKNVILWTYVVLFLFLQNRSRITNADATGSLSHSSNPSSSLSLSRAAHIESNHNNLDTLSLATIA